jgi:hypothetical protein
MSSRRATAAIDRLVRDRVIAKDSRDWLIAAVDPFHDLELNVRGYPDTNLAPSVVQLIKQSVTITAPSSAAGGDWDLHIFSMPITQTIKLIAVDQDVQAAGGDYAAQYFNTLATTTFGTESNLGTLSFQSGPSGTPLGVLEGVASLLDLQPYTVGACRVIAAGFEVVNNTAEIYKQGQQTCYRLPQPDLLSRSTYQFGPGGFPGGDWSHLYGSGSFRSLNTPPETIANAMLLSGSRQLAAAEGYYGTIPFSSPNLPPIQDDASGFLFYPNLKDNVRSICSNIVTGGTESLYQAPLGAGPQQNQHTIGSFFTGLSNQTSMTVTLNCWVEFFPSPYDQSLVVLATPSPRYDLIAQEIYSEALADMPVGVMVKENGLGDWFKDAVTKVSSWAGPALAAIPHPLAQAASGVAKIAGNLARPNTFMAPPNAKSVSQCSNEDLMAVLEERDARKRAAKSTKKMNKNRLKTAS